MNEQQWLSQAQTTAKPKPNPLFFVLAVLSGIPTAFLGLVYIVGDQNNLVGLGLIWSFMWTWVWWKMADRYR